MLLPQHIACTLAAFYAENGSKKAGSGTPKGVLARRRLSEASLRAGRAEDRGGGSCGPSRASFPPSWPSCGGPLGGRALGGMSVSRRRAPIFPFSLSMGVRGRSPSRLVRAKRRRRQSQKFLCIRFINRTKILPQTRRANQGNPDSLFLAL